MLRARDQRFLWSCFSLILYYIFLCISAEDAQDLQVKTLQAEMALMQEDMSNLKSKDEVLEKEKQHLECLLSIALKQLHPEKTLPDTLQNSSLSENDLEDYFEKLC